MRRIFLTACLSLLCITGMATAKGKLDWEEVGKVCAARYGLHDKSGRNSKAELDCIDYYNTHGKIPPTQKASERDRDLRNDWIQTLCAGVAGKASLNRAFQNYDSCKAWARFTGLSQNEAKHLSEIYGIDRN